MSFVNSQKNPESDNANMHIPLGEARAVYVVRCLLDLAHRDKRFVVLVHASNGDVVLQSATEPA